MFSCHDSGIEPSEELAPATVESVATMVEPSQSVEMEIEELPETTQAPASEMEASSPTNCQQNEFIGKRVSRFFEGHGMFVGTVSSFNPEADEGKDTWTVTYEDGDAEDLELADLMSGIEEYQKTHPGSDGKGQEAAESKPTKTQKKRKSKSEDWAPPEGWTIDTISVESKDGKPSKERRIWKHPDGTVFKQLAAAVQLLLLPLTQS